MTKTAARVAGVMGAAMLGLGVMAVPAQAHEQRLDAYGLCGGNPFTRCGYSWNSASHYSAKVCDTRADGYGAWLYWRRADGSHGLIKDSTDSGCGYDGDSSKLTEMKYCGVQGGYAYCGAWKHV